MVCGFKIRLCITFTLFGHFFKYFKPVSFEAFKFLKIQMSSLETVVLGKGLFRAISPNLIRKYRLEYEETFSMKRRETQILIVILMINNIIHSKSVY